MNRNLRIALVSAGLVAVVFSGMIVLGLSIDPNMFKGQIASAVKETSGLDISFDGPIKTTYFPSLGVQLNQVTVSAPKELGGAVLAKLGKADVSVKLLPLFSGRFETGEMTFDTLELSITRDEHGKLNLPVPPVKEVKLENQKVVVITENNERYSIDYQIQDVKMTNSRISFNDRMTKNSIALWDINLSTGRVVRGKNFPIKLAFDYSVADPDAAGRVELSGHGMVVPEAMQFAFENANLKTTVSGKSLPVKSIDAQYTGTIKVDGSNQTFSGEKLRIAAKASGGVLPDAGAGFNLAMDLKTDMKAGTADITGLLLDVMGFALSGEAHAVNLDKAAQVNVNLATNEFNPKQVLEKFGVGMQEAGTAKAQFHAQLDMAQGTADMTEVSINALGLNITSEAHATNIPANPQVKGKVDVVEFNPRQLMAKLGQPLPATADPSSMTKFQLAYSFEGHGDVVSMHTDVFKLDDTTMSLSATVEKAAKPKVSFLFKADSLDADRYSPPASAEKGSPAQKEQTKPVDIPAEVNGSIEIGKLKAAKLHMQNLSAKISINDNIMDINPAQLSLYQGTAKASVRTDLRGGSGAPLSVNANAEGIQVEPLLYDMQGKAKISGKASLNAAVTAKGQEPKQVLSTLGGKASFALRNGALLGFDFSPDVFSSPEKLLAQGKSQARTNFEVISGSYVLTNGVAHGNDLLVLIPPHRVTGQGWINLASETLDYNLQASFIKLPSIPVHLTGSLASPNVSVDAAGLATGVAKGVVDTVVKAPGEAIKIPESLGKGALDAVGSILGKPKK